MVDWGRVLAATGETLQGISDAAVISNWLEKEDEDAYIAVVTQVSTSSTDEVDRLDAALLSLAASNFSADTRRRLIKFYAVFKVAEMRRYQVFRGFPQLSGRPTLRAVARGNYVGHHYSDLVRHHPADAGGRRRVAVHSAKAAIRPAAQGGTERGVPAGKRFHREQLRDRFRVSERLLPDRAGD